MKKIVRIMGGLGNQLFQYAMARYWDIQYGADILLDVDVDSFETKREYSLEKLNVITYGLVPEHVKRAFRIARNNNHRTVFKVGINKILHYGFEKENFVFQDNNRFNYLDGYWQNTEYFKTIRKELLDEIMYMGKMNNEQKMMIKRISAANSVSVHIRRGDFCSEQNSKIYVIQEASYYLKAVNYLKTIISNPVFFVFSDDIEWCKDNIRFDENVFYIDKRLNKLDVEDFEMMRLCKNHIIANSTFSWWASWLAQYENKIVVSPKQWYWDEERNEKCKSAILDEVTLI